MRKQIFQAISTRLGESVPEIRTIDLWHGQTAAIGEGASWPLPAVFVEFEPIVWSQTGNGGRCGDVGVNLHLVSQVTATTGAADPNMADKLAFFDLVDKVNAALQGMRGDHFAGFQLTASTTGQDNPELMESIERHVTRVQDVTSMREMTKAQITTVNLRF